MPAVVKRTDGSFSGTSEADGIAACPRFLKNSMNRFRISSDCILIAQYFLYARLNEPKSDKNKKGQNRGNDREIVKSESRRGTYACGYPQTAGGRKDLKVGVFK